MFNWDAVFCMLGWNHDIRAAVHSYCPSLPKSSSDPYRVSRPHVACAWVRFALMNANEISSWTTKPMTHLFSPVIARKWGWGWNQNALLGDDSVCVRLP